MTLQNSIKVAFLCFLTLVLVIIFLPIDYTTVLGITVLLAIYLIISTVWFHISKKHRTRHLSKSLFAIGIFTIFSGISYALSAEFNQKYEGFEAIGVFIIGSIIAGVGLGFMALSAFFKLKND